VVGGISTITNTTAASSTQTGALVVAGGVGVGDALYASRVYAGGSQLLPTSIQQFTATTNQTTFIVAGGYSTVNFVFANGILLGTSDYTASVSPNVILATQRNSGDIITIVISQSASTPISNVAASVAMSVVLGM
jgi:hypothetical protein